MKDSHVPITEQSNTITQDIDRVKSEEIVELLYKCSLEVFYGWQGHPNVLSEEILKINDVSNIAAQYVKPDAHNVGIILSGCGTSGRIAFFISRKFNELAKAQKLRECYQYIISGGDAALMMSVESCEDDWQAGKLALENAAQGLDKVLFIGITCGLSAPFVGGQVEYCLQHPQRFTPYMLGFNPANQARNATISGTDKVMRDIALEMEAKGCLLNPVVGPEPITGSSRMKGGSVTKMLLEAAFVLAHKLATKDPTPIEYYDLVTRYEKTLHLAHTKDPEISSLIEMAGNSLIKGGSVVYIGWETLGIMGMIDAAECVPTFGANHDDVRCFLDGGFELLRNTQGDLSSLDKKLQISLTHFREKRYATISKNDTVIFIVPELSSQKKVELGTIAKSLKNQVGSLAIIAINTNNNWQMPELPGNPLKIQIVLPNEKETGNILHKFLAQCTTEICLKWVINAVSTGAHILKGKVFKNCMIDLKLSNKKLFERGIRIVSQFSNVSSDEAKECLLKSIYRQDLLNSIIKKADVSEHVKTAGYVERVIPLAILLSKGFNIGSGLKMLEDCPIVRQCIDNYL